MSKEEKKRPRRAKRIILSIVCGILIFALLAFISLMYIVPACETVDQTPVEGSEGWMKRLDSSLPLSKVVLPGAHDCATGTVQLAFFSKCQSLTVKEQLEAGVRYLDIRVALDGERLKLTHGFVDCTESIWPWSKPIYLDGLIDDCVRFLEANPSECIVFAVKNENKNDDLKQIQTLLERLARQNLEHWFYPDTIPTVGEARGKIVLLRRYADEASLHAHSGLPVLWQNQSSRADPALHTVKTESGGITLWVQDRYKYGTDEKWAAFEKGVEDSEASEDSISISFLSTNGSLPFGHPYFHAKTLNERLASSEIRLKGWIVADFVSPALCQRIYGENFR